MYSVGQKVRVISGPFGSGEYYQGLVGTITTRFEFDGGAQNKLLVRNEGDNAPILEKARPYHTNAPEMEMWFNDHELEGVTNE